MEAQKSIEQLQLLEQNLQNLIQQKQTFQSHLVEAESALSEIEKTPTAYKIVGSIMVQANKEDLKKDLTSKTEMYSLRIKAIEKQEARLKEKAESLQKDVLESMEEKNE